MLEHPEGGLEACFEFECCYCWAAGASMLGVWCTTRDMGKQRAGRRSD